MKHECVSLVSAGGVSGAGPAGAGECQFAAGNGHDRVIRLLISARASFMANNYGVTPVYVAAEHGHDRVIVTLARARASINDHKNDGVTPVAQAAYNKHDHVVRLLAHMGARLRMHSGQLSGCGFWVGYQKEASCVRMNDFWQRIISAGGDEPTEESRRLRRRMLVHAGKHDPRDGGPDEEPLE